MKKRNIRNSIVALLVLVVSLGAVFLCFWNNTDIPKLYLEGNISAMESKSDIRDITFRYRDDQMTVDGFAEIKVQGTSSLNYEKKNYTLNFFRDEAHEEDLLMDVGWGPQSKYCMKANWIDRTHARNVVSARLAGQMQAQYGLLTDAPNNGTVDGFPVEIYSNGKFLGLYTFNIPKDDWLFAMDANNPDHIVIGGERFDPANLFLAEPDFYTWAVEVGEESEETLEKMNRLFGFVIHSDDETFRKDFETYLNLDSALNYYLFCEIAYLEDNLGKNMLIATYDARQWYLSLYDLDSSWGTYYNGRALYPYEEGGLNIAKNNLFKRMDLCFRQELEQRYAELRSSVLSEANIMNQFLEFRDQIPALTFVKEGIRWGTGPIRRIEDLPGYDYSQIQEFLSINLPRLDEKYHYQSN